MNYVQLVDITQLILVIPGGMLGHNELPSPIPLLPAMPSIASCGNHTVEPSNWSQTTGNLSIFDNSVDISYFTILIILFGVWVDAFM